MQTITDGILTNYEILGKSKKQSILMIHGWGRNLNDWTDIAKELAKENKVILVDLPGFGGSSLPEGIFDTYSYANFIQSLIEKLRIKNVTLVGHSFGGKISTVVASQSKDIKKLFLVDASGVEDKKIISNIKIGLAKAIKPLASFLPKTAKNLIFESLASSDYKNAGLLKESFKKIVSQDVSKEAKKILIPTIIIWGDKDKEVPVEAAKKFQELIQNSRIRIVWNSGHNPHLEKPKKFLEIIKDNI